MDIKKTITKYALQNAIRYDGKANTGAIIGKVIAENPKLKLAMKEVSKEIKEIVDNVNSMAAEAQLVELKKLAPELLEKKEKQEKDIFEFLKIPEGEKIITAFPPEPSKYPHIGHAKAIIVNYELAKRNKGEFIIRFDDTNPLLVKEEFYKIHLENYKWLGIQHDKLEYASDYMEKFYEFAEKLIKMGKAYACDCPQETIKENRFKGIECKCRSNSIEANMEKWKEMFISADGTIIRLKIDISHKNTTMRDPAIMRIIVSEHPRLTKKYRVWPTYDFETTMMDSFEGVTHRIRSKEFEMRNELQRYIQSILGFKETSIYEFARFNMEGVESSGRIIREKIEKKELIGWDDPSLTTIVALRRRGFLPEAIYNFVLSTGITKTESTITWDTLYAFNKKIADSRANRYFFIESPIKIEIAETPNKEIKLNLHPDFPERGIRAFEITGSFYISKADLDVLKDNSLNRLMDCINFTKKGSKFYFDSLDYEAYSTKGDKIIHWLSASDKTVDVEIVMPDKTRLKGMAEKGIKNLPVGELIQFARFGFCRLDENKEGRIVFWFTHK